MKKLIKIFFFFVINLLYTTNIVAQPYYTHYFTPHEIAGGDFSMIDIYKAISIDLDRDGDMDVLAVSREDGKVTWFENNGRTFFTAHTISDSAGGPKDVFAIDMDGDNDIDVLSAGFWGNRINWYENDGNQNFRQDTVSTKAIEVRKINALDIDKDGDIDVLATLDRSRTLMLYENDGNQNFLPHSIGENNIKVDEAPTAIDLDGDGDLDLLHSTNNEYVVWFENEGDLIFTKRSLGLSEWTVYPVDLDNDNDIDFVSWGSRELLWYENNENVYFSQHSIHSIPSDAHSIVNIMIVDLDSDNDSDLLLSGKNWYWYENDGDQNFTEHSLTIPPYAITGSVFTCDIDQDNDIDILVGGHETISYLENDGNQNFTIQYISVYLITDLIGGLSVIDLNTIDFDGDTDIDIVISGYWFENDGYQYFQPHKFLSDYFFRQLKTIDIDKDGDIDILTHINTKNISRISLWSNDGNLNFQEKVIVQNGASPTNSQVLFETTDFDYDQDIDIIVSWIIGTEITRIQWFENNGNERFFVREISNSRGGKFCAIDLDNDNDMDILSVGDSLIWYKNDGSNSFSIDTITTAETHTASAADLDNDGDIDVLAYTDFDDQAYRAQGYWYENIDNDNFIPHLIPRANSHINYIGDLYTLDIDKNKTLDIFALDGSGITILKNLGNAEFNYEWTISGVVSFKVTDLDKDDALDIIVCNHYSQYKSAEIIWYKNGLPIKIGLNSDNNISNKFILSFNYPNPFNPSTNIEYSIPKSSTVVVSVYNLTGQKITTLVNQNHTPGNYQVTWDGADYASGVYIYQIKADNFIQSKKMLLLK